VKTITKLKPQPKTWPPAVPLEVLRRMSLYLRGLNQMKARGVSRATSAALVAPLNISAAQLRKDLSYFGKFGKCGLGYSVDALSADLKKILGTNKAWNVAVVGAGALGSALLKYHGFAELNLRVCAAFDTAPEKTGRVINGIMVRSMSEFPEVAAQNGIHVAILAVSRESAEAAAAFLIQHGVKAILNLSSVHLTAPAGVCVSNMDMSCELETLICRLGFRS